MTNTHTHTHTQIHAVLVKLLKYCVFKLPCLLVVREKLTNFYFCVISMLYISIFQKTVTIGLTLGFPVLKNTFLFLKKHTVV